MHSAPAAARTHERRVLAALGPFAYLASLFLLSLLVWSVSRALLTLALYERVRVEPRHVLAFPLGLRMDSVTASYLLVPPTLLLLTLPGAFLRRLRSVLVAYSALVSTLLVLLEAISYDFIEQYDVRPDRLFIENLRGSREVLGTIWAQYHWHVLGVVVLALLALLSTARLASRLLLHAPEWPASRRLVALPLFAPLLLLGMRGTLQHRPLNAASVAFSGHNLVNQLTLN